MRRRQREISLDEKLRYLREIENIHRLSKKVLPPRGPTWARIPDKPLQRALGMPIKGETQHFTLQPGGYMHEHSPRTARAVERTLRSGLIHPDALHSYRNDGPKAPPVRRWTPKPKPREHDQDVIHYVQHGSQDLVYPHGHLQGYGFVPSTHGTPSHVQLEDSVRPVQDTVPTKGGVAAGEAYH